MIFLFTPLLLLIITLELLLVIRVRDRLPAMLVLQAVRLEVRVGNVLKMRETSLERDDVRDDRSLQLLNIPIGLIGH